MSIKNLIDKAIKQIGQESRNEVLYYCPICKHHKKKLSVNIETGNWKCWVCGDTHNTKGKSIYTFFNLFKVNSDYYNQLQKYIKPNKKTFSDNSIEIKKVVKLPSEFKSLTVKSIFPEYRQAVHYLNMRGLTYLDILKYNIGYCMSGEYKNRIIVPSYDSNGDLNYFISRSWNDNVSLKYKNPPISKNVIGFEMFINWKLSEVCLCEGVFDAIAIKRNAIPLFGKTINNTLFLKLIQEKVKSVYIILDNDAIYSVIKSCELLESYGINVYYVKLNDKDPSHMGYKKIHQLINTTQKLQFDDFLKLKLSL